MCERTLELLAPDTNNIAAAQPRRNQRDFLFTGRRFSHLHRRRHLRLDGELHQLVAVSSLGLRHNLVALASPAAGLPLGGRVGQQRGAVRAQDMLLKTAIGALLPFMSPASGCLAEVAKSSLRLSYLTFNDQMLWTLNNLKILYFLVFHTFLRSLCFS